MDDLDSARMLGEVQGSLASLTVSVATILANQERDREGTAEAARSLNEKLDLHARQDDKSFAEIRDGLGGLRDRIARFEQIADTVESHGDAILTMEKRTSDAETVRKIAHSTNRKWRNGIIAAASGTAGVLLGGDHAGKIYKWLLSLGKS